MIEGLVLEKDPGPYSLNGRIFLIRVIEKQGSL